MPDTDRRLDAIPWFDDLKDYAKVLFAVPESWGDGEVRAASWKVIHDPIWGSQRWDDWQVAIIDSPAMQRLRDIKQTSLAFLTYPGAVHTRFEHSLGVAAATKLYLDSLEADDPTIGLEVKANVVAAALLHDIGHGPFSHLSEECYAYRPDWFDGVLSKEEDDAEEDPLYLNAAPHEALGALLLRTPAAEQFFQKMRSTYGVPQLDLKVIGDIIAGSGWAGHDHVAQAVNGSFDADKADYLRRDAHFAGLDIALDVNRLSHTLRVVLDESGDRQIALHSAGEAVANQFLFAKTTLTSSVYHHHKVRAADCLYRTVIGRSLEADPPGSINGVALTSPVAFLRLTDSDFISRYSSVSDPQAKRALDRVRDRDLHFACVRIRPGSDRTTTWEDLRLTKNLWKNADVLRRCREIANKIADEIGVPEDSVWLDFPAMVSLSSLPLTDGHSLAATMSSFPADAWVEQYVQYVYTGFVFAEVEDADRVAKVFGEHALEDFGEELDEWVFRLPSAYRTPT